MYFERKELLNKLINVGLSVGSEPQLYSDKRHYVYVVYHKETLKMYVGKRSCVGNIADDNYMGSDILIKLAIDKEGVDKFDKKVLALSNHTKINLFDKL